MQRQSFGLKNTICLVRVETIQHNINGFKYCASHNVGMQVSEPQIKKIFINKKMLEPMILYYSQYW